jgi:hypothetical protein
MNPLAPYLRDSADMQAVELVVPLDDAGTLRVVRLDERQAVMMMAKLSGYIARQLHAQRAG